MFQILIRRELLANLMTFRFSVYREIAQIWEAFEREQADFLRNDRVEGEDPNFNVPPSGSQGTHLVSDPTTLKYFKRDARLWTRIDPDSEPQIPHVKAYFQSQNLGIISLSKVLTPLQLRIFCYY